MGDSAPQILRPPERAYYPTHDTAQTHAHWAGNPVASRSLDRCDAARTCDARVQRQLNPPDDHPPSACDWHTGNAGWSAQRDERHPHQGTPRCPARQPDSPHAEGSRSDRLEARGRAHHRELHPQWKRTLGPRSPRRRGSSPLEKQRAQSAQNPNAAFWIPAFAGNTAARSQSLTSRIKISKSPTR